MDNAPESTLQCDQEIGSILFKAKHIRMFLLTLFSSLVAAGIGIKRPADSMSFIFWLPILFYVFYRIVIQFSLRMVISMALMGCISTFCLFLPWTRSTIAAHYLEQSSRELDLSRLPSAQLHLIRAMQWDMNHPDIPYVRYRIANAVGNENDARTFLAEAVENGKDDAESLYDLARLYAKAGMRAKEVPLYHRVLEVRPNHAEANYCLAMYYDIYVHDKEKAIHHLKIARDHLPYENEWRKRCIEILDKLQNEP